MFKKLKSIDKKVLIITLIIIFSIALLGTSYAVFKYQRSGSSNTIVMGNLEFALIDGQDVTLEKVVPLSDKIGAVSSDNVYTFKVSNTSSEGGDLFYDLVILNNNLDNGKHFTNDQIKVNLKKNDSTYIIGSESSGILLSDLLGFDQNKSDGESQVSTSIPINAGTTDTYELRVWVDENVDYSGEINDNGISYSKYQDYSYSIKVRVGATSDSNNIEPPIINTDDNNYATVKNVTIVKNQEDSELYFYSNINAKTTTKLQECGSGNDIDSCTDVEIDEIEGGHWYRAFDNVELQYNNKAVITAYSKTNAGISKKVTKTINKIDTTAPSCTFDKILFVGINQMQEVNLTCTDMESGIVEKDLTSKDFTIDNIAQITSIKKVKVDNGYKYTLGVSATDSGTFKIVLNSSSIIDNVGNGNLTTATNGIQVSTINTDNGDMVIDLAESKTKKLNVSTNASGLTYQSNNLDIAKVNSDGVVTGIKPGTATITVLENSTNTSKVVTVKIVKTVTLQYITQTGIKKMETKTETCVVEDDKCQIQLPVLESIEGYTVDGWYDASNNKITDISYQLAENTSILAKANVKAYAVNYDFKTNGGNNTSLENSNANYKEAIDLTPKATKDGWIFVGWNTNKNAKTGLKELTMGSKDVTLYAIYKKEAVTYKASFVKQGRGVTAIGANDLTCTIKEVYNNEVQDTSCTIVAPKIAVRDNYEAIGWNTDKNAHEGIKIGSDITLNGNNTSYYAISKKNPITYTVTFIKQGLGVTAIEKDKVICSADAAYNDDDETNSCELTLPNITVSSGYTAIGWNTLKDATSGNQVGEKVKITENVTYYAITRKDEVIYQATFVKQGTGVTSIGTEGLQCKIDAVYNDSQQAESCDITLPNITVSDGYTVIGWNTLKDATSGNQVGEKVKLTSNVTYYAISKKNAITLTAKWDANGSTLSSTDASKCILNEVYNNNQQDTSCTVKAPTITRNGYNIIGYANSIDAVEKVLDNSGTLTLNTSNTGKTWYAITSKNVSSLTITISPSSYTYDGIAKTPTVVVKDGDITLKQDTDYTVNYTNNTNVGTATVTITGKGVYNSNSKTIYVNSTNKTFTITGNGITVTADGASKTYDGLELIKTNSCKVTGGNLLDGHKVECVTNGSITNVGSSTNTLSTVKVTDASGNDVTGNYIITKINGTLTVNKRETTCTAGSSSKVYDGNSLTNNTVTCDNLVSGQTSSVGSTANVGSQTNVGSSANTPKSAKIVSGSTDVTENYSITYKNGTLTITRATTAIANPANKTYNGTSQTGVSGSYITWTGTTEAIDVGTYTASATPDSNHAWSDGTTSAKTVTWTMGAKSIAVSWGSTTSFNYTGSEQAPSVSATSGVTGETINVTRTTAVNAGSYTSTATCSSVEGGQKKCSNYNLTGNTKGFTINKVSAVNPTLTGYTGDYDGSSHTITVTGGSGGTIQYSTDNSTWSTTKPTRTDVGTTTVYVRVVGDANHNTTSSISANIVINYKKDASASASNKTYNGASQTGVSGANVSWSGTTSAIDAGTYTATATPTTNHAWSDGTTTAKTITWTMSAKSIAVSWGSTTSFNYTGGAQAPTATAASGVTGETINVTRTTATNAGTYTSTASCSSVSGGRAKCSNYNLTGNTKSFTINKVSAVNPTLTGYTGDYDGNSHTITVTGGSGGTIQYSTDNKTFSTTKPTRTNVGTTTVYVRVAGDANHNTTSSISANIVINYKKDASASASNKTYNGASQTGVSGSNVSWSGTTSAIDAGTYTATATPVANHAWSDGTTTAKTITWKMSAKSIAVSWGSTTSFNYTGGAQAPSATAASGVSGETINITRTTAVNAGSYTSTASCSSVDGGQKKCSNYNLTGNTKGYTINKISATNPSISGYTGDYDGSSHTITVSGGWGGTIEYSTDNKTFSTTKPTRTNVGTTTVYVRVAGDANHNTTASISANIVINYKKDASASAVNKTYNGASQTGVTGANVNWSGTTSGIDAGTYTATATPVANHAWSDGTTSAKTITWTMSAKSIAVSWGTTTTFNYTGSWQAPSAAAASGVTGETINVTRTGASDSGSYTSTASCSSVTGGRAKCANYTFTSTTKAFTIKVVTAPTISIAQTAVNPTGTAANVVANSRTYTVSFNGLSGLVSPRKFIYYKRNYKEDSDFSFGSVTVKYCGTTTPSWNTTCSGSTIDAGDDASVDGWYEIISSNTSVTVDFTITGALYGMVTYKTASNAGNYAISSTTVSNVEYTSISFNLPSTIAMNTDLQVGNYIDMYVPSGTKEMSCMAYNSSNTYEGYISSARWLSKGTHKITCNITSNVGKSLSVSKNLTVGDGYTVAASFGTVGSYGSTTFTGVYSKVATNLVGFRQTAYLKPNTKGAHKVIYCSYARDVEYFMYDRTTGNTSAVEAIDAVPIATNSSCNVVYNVEGPSVYYNFHISTNGNAYVTATKINDGSPAVNLMNVVIYLDDGTTIAGSASTAGTTYGSSATIKLTKTSTSGHYIVHANVLDSNEKLYDNVWLYTKAY